MKRGIIQLTSTQLEAAYAFFEQSQIAPTLLSKFAPAVSSDESEVEEKQFHTIELSREDAETILDTLGPPLQHRSLELRNLRAQLLAFLQS